MRIRPIASEVEFYELGAAAVGGANQVFHVSGRLCPLTYTLDLVWHGSVDKDVEHVGPILQDALRAASDNDAVALAIGILYQVARQSRHGFGVEDVSWCDGRSL